MRRIFVAVVAVGVAAVATGCSGLEIGGKAWIASIDEKSESSRTYRSTVPLKCYFTDCTPGSEAANLPAK